MTGRLRFEPQAETIGDFLCDGKTQSRRAGTAIAMFVAPEAANRRERLEVLGADPAAGVGDEQAECAVAVTSRVPPRPIRWDGCIARRCR